MSYETLEKYVDACIENNEINGVGWNSWKDVQHILDTYDQYDASDLTTAEVEMLSRAVESNGQTLADDLAAYSNAIEDIRGWSADSLLGSTLTILNNLTDSQNAEIVGADGDRTVWEQYAIYRFLPIKITYHTTEGDREYAEAMGGDWSGIPWAERVVCIEIV